MVDTEFGAYQVDGHQSLAVVFEGPLSAITGNPMEMPDMEDSQLSSTLNSLLNIKGLMLMSPLDDGKAMTFTYMAFDQGFDKNIPKVESMIISISLTGSSSETEEFQSGSDSEDEDDNDD